MGYSSGVSAIFQKIKSRGFLNFDHDVKTNSYADGNLSLVQAPWQPFTRFLSAIYQNKPPSPVSFL